MYYVLTFALALMLGFFEIKKIKIILKLFSKN